MRKRDIDRSSHLHALHLKQAKEKKKKEKELPDKIRYLKHLSHSGLPPRTLSFRLRSEARRLGVQPHILKTEVLRGYAV